MTPNAGLPASRRPIELVISAALPLRRQELHLAFPSGDANALVFRDAVLIGLAVEAHPEDVLTEQSDEKGALRVSRERLRGHVAYPMGDPPPVYETSSECRISQMRF